MKDDLEKRALMAVGLSLLVMFLWWQFTAPPPAPDTSVPDTGVTMPRDAGVDSAMPEHTI